MTEALRRARAACKRPFALLAFVVAVVVWTTTVCDAAAQVRITSRNERQSDGAR
jgi:hypothetical protein